MSDERQIDGNIYLEDVAEPERGPVVMASDDPANQNTHGLTYSPSPAAQAAAQTAAAGAVPGLSSSSFTGAVKAMISKFTIIQLKTNDGDLQTMEKNLYLLPIFGFLLGMVVCIVGMIMLPLGVDPYISAVVMIGLTMILMGLRGLGNLMDYAGESDDKWAGVGIVAVTVLLLYGYLAFAEAASCAFMWLAILGASNTMAVAAIMMVPSSGSSNITQAAKSLVITLILGIAMAVIVLGVIDAFAGMNFLQTALKSYAILTSLTAVVSTAVGMLLAVTAQKTGHSAGSGYRGSTFEIGMIFTVITVFTISITLGLGAV